MAPGLREHGEGHVEAEDVSAMDLRFRMILLRLPLAPAHVLAQLQGQAHASSARRTLLDLEAKGLVGAVPYAGQVGKRRRLWYLTAAGMAICARHLAVNAADLARVCGLRHGNLARLALGAPHLLATYELLGALAVSQPGRPRLLAWRYPWRLRFEPLLARHPVTVRLPAYAALAWGAGCVEVLLLPDLGAVRPRAYERALGGLLDWRRVVGDPVPTPLIVTTHPGRVAAWQRLLDEASATRFDTLLPAVVVTWDNLRRQPSPLARLPLAPSSHADSLVQHVSLKRDVEPSAPVCHQGVVPTRDPFGKGEVARLAHIAVGLTPVQREALDLIGRHPFLSVEDVAVVIGWTPAWARWQLKPLEADRLLRFLDSWEIRCETGETRLLEVTTNGLKLLAAQQGLSVATAVRHNGLIGGGPTSDIEGRPKLLQHLAHTLGVNKTVTHLYRIAHERRAHGYDDAVVEWRSAAACATRVIRPDGYVVYRHNGRQTGFFLEYDRGTMQLGQYRAKFAAYYSYLEQGLWERDYQSMPTVLVVTTSFSATHRIHQALQGVSVGRAASLQVHVTGDWQLTHSRDVQACPGLHIASPRCGACGSAG